jgi:hypothetical protein
MFALKLAQETQAELRHKSAIAFNKRVLHSFRSAAGQLVDREPRLVYKDKSLGPFRVDELRVRKIYSSTTSAVGVFYFLND